MICRLTSCDAVFGLAVVLGLAGCGGPTPSTAPPVTGEQQEGDRHSHGVGGHPEEGPHQGQLIELGQEEYHAELTHDDATKTVAVFLLDKEAKTAVPIADSEIVLNLIVDGKPLQIKLTAAPQEGDPQGQASRFSIMDEAVLEALESPKTTGRLNVTIGGKSFTGSIEHHDHDEKK